MTFFRLPADARTISLPTPSGTPASAMSLSSRNADSGVSSAGLTSMLHPPGEGRRKLGTRIEDRSVPREDQPHYERTLCRLLSALARTTAAQASSVRLPATK